MVTFKEYIKDNINGTDVVGFRPIVRSGRACKGCAHKLNEILPDEYDRGEG